MLKITKDGKKIAVLKDDASEPEMIEVEKKDKKKESKPEQVDLQEPEKE